MFNGHPIEVSLFLTNITVTLRLCGTLWSAHSSWEMLFRREEPELRPTALEVWQSPRFHGLAEREVPCWSTEFSWRVICFFSRVLQSYMILHGLTSCVTSCKSPSFPSQNHWASAGRACCRGLGAWGVAEARRLWFCGQAKGEEESILN